jgi:pyruvate dehydrogenase E2 component (dihydrolipoamide acetyltransferase)
MDVLMPQLGETVAEGRISTWFKQVGDPVRPGDNLFEIETDKVSMEVPATSAGVLAEIRVAKGEVVPVGAVVAVIAGEGGAAEVARDASLSAFPLPSGERVGVRGDRLLDRPVTPSPHPSPQRGEGGRGAPPRTYSPAMPLDPFFEVRTPERNFGPARLPGGATVTPLARRLAGERGIDLAAIKGSGPHGRIVARDVEAMVARGPALAPPPPALAFSAQQVLALYRDVPFTEVPLDGMRRTIAARLVQSTQTVPHFSLTLDCMVDDLVRVREDANAAAPKGKDGSPGFRLSLNDFVVKALALALQRVPAANAVWAEDRILRFTQSDIGVAVALDGGLLTPVIRKAEAKSLGAISNELRDLAARARARKLAPHEYQGGASAVSNLGMYGIREFSAIINPPHATILAVGAAQRRPVEGPDGGIAFATQMTVTLSCDHRVVDGALGAELLAAFKGFIERPVTMLV